MRVVVHLTDDVPIFSASEAQVSALRARCPAHTFTLCLTEEEFLSELTRAEACVVWRFAADWYDKAPRLRLVATPAAGRERVALDASGRVRAYFGTFHGRLMGESLLAMILFMNRRLAAALAAQERHAWDRNQFLTTRRLSGQTALLIGYGAIARHAATLLKALGVIVHGVKRDIRRGTAGLDRVFAPDALSQALSNADHIACILPGEAQTDNLLGEAEFEHMKQTAYVYNLGRGNAIDASCLEQALRTRRIAGAFLDVLPTEPLPKDSSLWHTPNLYLTPHASAVYCEYLDLYFEELAELLNDS